MRSTDLRSTSLEVLLTQYREADAKAFYEFYLRSKPVVLAYLNKLIPSADVSDAFQDTYLRVHRYIMTYDPNRSAMMWILSIARNVARDHWRSSRVRQGQIDLDASHLESTAKTSAMADFSSLISQACIGLSKQEVSLLVERVFEETSFEDLAEKHGLTPVNARQKISRILRRIRRALTESELEKSTKESNV